MANRLTGKIVLVTGAASGLGEAQARVFAREGAKVMLADISTAGADAAAKIRDEGGSADFVQLDVSKLESWKDAVSAAVQTFGGLTSLSNTAGIIHMQALKKKRWMAGTGSSRLTRPVFFWACRRLFPSW